MCPGCGNSGPDRGCCSSLDELLLVVVFIDEPPAPPPPLESTDELPRGLLPNVVFDALFNVVDELLFVGTSYSTAVPSIKRDLKIESRISRTAYKNPAHKNGHTRMYMLSFP